jgi:hypothetical protein
MAELRLRRDEADKKRYVLDGVGELQRGKWYERGAAATDTGGRTWELKPSAWKRSAVAVDAGGDEAARYEPEETFKRGGRLVVAGGGSYDLKPSSAWRNRYALWSGEEELASVETKGWSGREVAVSIADDADVDPLVLLTACWLVRLFGEDDAAAAATGGAAGS